MKRANKGDQNCRRMEFKCRLYDIIKDLEGSLDPGVGSRGQYQSTSSNQQYGFKTKEHSGSKPKCCCPPGCCKESLELRLPKFVRDSNNQNGEGVVPPNTHTGDEMKSALPWHDEDHSRGCWPGHGNQGEGGARGVGGACYYCVDSAPPQNVFSNTQVQVSTSPPRLPTNPEEMQQMGCFFARVA